MIDKGTRGELVELLADRSVLPVRNAFQRRLLQRSRRQLLHSRAFIDFLSECIRTAPQG